MPSTVQEADLQWIGIVEQLIQATRPTLKEKTPTKTPLIIQYWIKIRCVPDIHGTYVFGTYVQSRRL